MGDNMDLDNINNIEVLRELAKSTRAKVKENISAYNGNYIFKKGFWYIVEQDEWYVYLFSEDYAHTVALTYKEEDKYLY